MSRASRRGPWLPDEDTTLLHLVRTQGPNNWVRISQHMQHRSPKQCRERYHQNLKPSLNHEPITAQEGEVIEQLVQEMGKRWAEIARRLGNRSDNAVKNWWNGSMNRRKRNSVQHSGSSKAVGYRTHPIPASAPPRSVYPYEHSPILRETFPPSYAFPPSFQRHESTSSLPILAESSPLRSDFAYESQSHAGRFHFRADEPVKSSSYPSTDHSIDKGRHPSPREAMTSVHRDHRPLSRLREGLPVLPRLEEASLRLPPINSLEQALPSPAATEASHASSNQQAPSLISDNQSICSISPKTIPSPRPGVNTVKASSTHLWGDTVQGSSREAYSGPNLGRAAFHPDSRAHRIDTTANRSPQHNGHHDSIMEKDHRMTLARLLD